jgi:hypothetical protein
MLADVTQADNFKFEISNSDLKWPISNQYESEIWNLKSQN